MHIEFNRPYSGLASKDAVNEVLLGTRFAGGGNYSQKCQDFFRDKYGFEHNYLTSSCTDALEMCAMLLKISKGDQVIIPSFSYVTCAHAFENAEVDAADISVDALEVAEINIDQHGLWQQVTPIQSDVFSGLQGQVYDLIVSNPPYVDQEDMDDLPAEFRHEPELGLASGYDGLEITETILAQACDHLSEQGVLIVEVGNSYIHLEQKYPQVPFKWIEFERGGHGVFMIDKPTLEQHKHVFSK